MVSVEHDQLCVTRGAARVGLDFRIDPSERDAQADDDGTQEELVFLRTSVNLQTPTTNEKVHKHIADTNVAGNAIW